MDRINLITPRLEEYLKTYPNTLLLTSHSEDFLNGVCTNIMQLTLQGTLVTWGGNYATYVKTREEHEKNQMTKYKKERDDIQHLQEFIRSCGTYSNMRKQAGFSKSHEACWGWNWNCFFCVAVISW